MLDCHLEPETNMEVHRIAALPGGEVVISNKRRTANHVLRLNKGGEFDKKLYTCDHCVEIGALLLLGNNVFVIHINGTVIQIHPHTAQIVNIYQIENAASVIHTGCLYSDPTSIDTDLLLLADQGKGEVFSYRLSSNSNKQFSIKVKGEFIRYLLDHISDNIHQVKSLSIYYPFLWVSSSRVFLRHHLPYKYKFGKYIMSTTVKDERNSM